MQFKHLLLALWAGLAVLTWYRSASPSRTLDILYSVAFGVVFIVSLVYLARRRTMKK